MTMPNFLIIGAAKCGTTALYHYLDQHPEIYMSPEKEPRFFALEGEIPDFRGPADDRGINRCRFTNITAYRELFRGVSGEKAAGEASTLYLYSPKAPERISHHVPDAKLIAVLRNPVDRAYSAFLFMLRDSREPLSDFGRALAEEERRIAENWGPEYHYRRRGFYHSQLKRYYERFGGDQIKVYLYDELNSDPAGVVRDIFRFLGVDDAFEPDMSSRHNVSGVPQSRVLQSLYLSLRKSSPAKSALKALIPEKPRRKMYRRVLSGVQKRNLGKAPPLSPETREELIEAYREDIIKTQDLIGKDLSGWLK
ncbi:MAG: sulfotransferase family protein [Rubrobacteraceae bacterium]